MKKTLVMLLVLVLCLSLFTACGSSTEDEAAAEPAEAGETAEEVVEEAAAATTDKTELVVGGYGDVTSFDPLVDGTNTSTMIDLCVYDTLFKIDEDGSFDYQLAESAEWVEDNGEWLVVITIRPDVYFQSGDQLQCEDVLYTMMRMIDSMMYSSRVASANFDAATIEGYTLTIPMYQYDACFLPNMSSELGYIVNKSYFDEVGAEEAFRTPDGTGPYKMTDWTANVSVTLERNENYWGTPGEFESIVYKFFSDDNTRVLEFEAGNLDLCVVESAENVDSIAAGDYKGCELFSWNTNKQGMFFFNNSTESSPFYENEALRKAISYAIDLDAIVSSVGGSTTIPATSSLASGSSVYEDHTHVYDPDLAKQYLEEAGYPDGFSFTIMVASDQGANLKMAEAIQAYLSMVNIDMEIESMDLFTLMGYQMSGEQMCGIVENTVRGDDYEMYQGMVQGSGNMLCEIHNDDFQALVDQLAHESDTAVRNQLFSDIQTMIDEECYFVPLYQDVGTWAYHDYVAGLDRSAVLGAERLVDLAALSFNK